MFMLWGVIFGEITRDYGHGFKVTTFLNGAALMHLLPSGVLPIAVNDNMADAA